VILGLLRWRCPQDPATLGVTAVARCRRRNHVWLSQNLRRITSNNPALETAETQSFLHGKLERGGSEYSANLPIQYDEGSGKQLRKILLDSSFRWFITAGLCAVYILVTVVWMKKGPVNETSKKTYNTITTMISILLGLNIASAFKDMALNMRWPILSHQKRSLKEVSIWLCGKSRVR
jgi:hypothetical protein